MDRSSAEWSWDGLCLSLRVAAFGFITIWLAVSAFAIDFGSVRGIVHDPQHRPIKGASVILRARASDWVRNTQSNAEGSFQFQPVPVGEYSVTVENPGFSSVTEAAVVLAGTQPVLHIQLNVALRSESVTVTEPGEALPTDSVTPTTMVSRDDIKLTPGADRTNSMQMITEFVPAAYMAHDMLHIRGGHQFQWLIDGVPIPNTNIASNLGPQIDPKDIDYLEVQRGSYDANIGDRTYGVFDIVPRTGFERDRECDLLLSFGNFYQTNDQVSCGDHSQRSAYYFSLNGNRSDYGLETPVPQVYHDAQNGYGGFGSYIFNKDPKNQLRLVGSLRQDYYQVPYDPDPNSAGNQISPSYGLRDSDRETDGYLAFTWIHTFNANTLLTVSPFYHYNSAMYIGGPNDFPVITNANQTANYGGAQVTLSANVWRNEIQAGVYGFGEHQHNYFENTFTDGSPTFPPSSIATNGGLTAFFLNDKFKVTSWLMVMAGIRETYFTSDVTENATDPRVGATLRIPKLNWVFRAFYGHYYQAPPLMTASGPLLDFANSQNLAFSSLRGERDIETQYGVTIPYRGWTLDADTYHTHATNWLDHNNIGESNLFWPITWQSALIDGWELTLRSPRLRYGGQFHLAYANQIAQATSPITGGLICPPGITDCDVAIPPGYGPVDHDQRNTLTFGYRTNFFWRTYASADLTYGSGMSNGLYGTPESQYPGLYLPAHTTFDLSLTKSFLERYSVSATAVNVTNQRVQLDNSLTFGGFHWNEPRQIYGEFRYRFKL